ncbi:diguanylate cyclase/phosphodiesterase (GGDEF & EAL domains) with PAS/PAC sensor(s) [hydrothermal vent metagenome]|uniref:Diguanylate cyclase/phosphodiesterase (GGDEF & EAL domains) with PAS/PAC sensor(S) n=1 Tax=hydrothermal vent metagenome TaxID=652676 RepID=A0A3B0WBT9_9ZZZZ
MLELSNRNNSTTKTLSDVGRFMEADRSRTQQMIDRSLFKMDNDATQILRTLQTRFSSDDHYANNDADFLPNEIKALIEDQVKIRTQTLFRQANYDDLTHLPNRAYFNATLESLVIGAKEKKGEFTLLFLDLDGFKKINDNFGHQSGDELLRNVSARVISAVREGDIVSRLGGDEFVVLLAGELAREDIEGVCKRIISEVSRSYWIAQNEIQISTSIGVACYPKDAKSSSELVEKSDKALYASKDSGRNTYRFYSDLLICEPTRESSYEITREMASEIQSNCRPLDRLKEALTQGQIKVCFEPQVDLVSQKIVGSSVTALWMENRIESPYLNGWMEILNQSHWARSTGAWLIDSGLYYLQQWQGLNDELVVSIPVIPALCQSEDMVAFMNGRLVEYQVTASQVQLEFSAQTLTESAVQHQLNALSEAGYQITLTEVGKAPLDLALLSDLNLQEIKLDTKWLKKSLVSKTGQKWLQAVVKMANILDADVIATGIESQQTVKQLQAMGCTMGQGILWALPLEADGFHQAISAQLPAVH